MNNQNDEFVNLRNYRRPREELLSSSLQHRKEDLNNYIRPEELLKLEVVFAEDFFDDRKEHGIVRGPKGTFYFNGIEPPFGVDVIPAKFSHSYKDERTVSYRKMYINVQDGSSDSLVDGIVHFDDKEIAYKVYIHTVKFHDNIELIDNKIYIYKDKLLVDYTIQKYMNQLNKEERDRERKHKQDRLEEALKQKDIDDEYDFG